jgi:hypothetical protein
MELGKENIVSVFNSSTVVNVHTYYMCVWNESRSWGWCVLSEIDKIGSGNGNRFNVLFCYYLFYCVLVVLEIFCVSVLDISLIELEKSGGRVLSRVGDYFDVLCRH